MTADDEARQSRAVGTLIREHREWAGYSRVRLGDLVGVPAEELERWELTGVPLPPSEQVRSVAEFLDIEPERLDAAVSGEKGVVPDRDMSFRHFDQEYGAVPQLDYALDVRGFTPEALAEALDTTPTMVQAWRLGAIEMTVAERLALTGLIHPDGT
jgi:hypothetical protein